MPMQDWTRVDDGVYHDFRQGWTIELRNALNRGILPPGYFARADQRVGGPEPDVVTYRNRLTPDPGGGTAVSVAPPRSRLSAQAHAAELAYARKANRVSVRSSGGRVVAIIEIVSPGNKHSELAVQSFTRKLAEFVQHGVHVLLIDPFPPGPRDPDGLHQLVWAAVSNTPIGRRPVDLPLTAAAFDVDEDITAYVEPFAVGDRLPDVPLFLEPGWYVTVPLEPIYQASWDVLPAETKDLFA